MWVGGIQAKLYLHQVRTRKLMGFENQAVPMSPPWPRECPGGTFHSRWRESVAEGGDPVRPFFHILVAIFFVYYYYFYVGTTINVLFHYDYLLY